MVGNKLGSKIKNTIFDNKKKHEDELTQRDVSFTKDEPTEEKKTSYKWRFNFKLTTGIMIEIITIETITELDAERIAFNQALKKMLAHEKYRGSTDLSYTQKFTKEIITNE